MITTTFCRTAAGVVRANTLRTASTWAAVPAGPPDPILGWSQTSLSNPQLIG